MTEDEIKCILCSDEYDEESLKAGACPDCMDCELDELLEKALTIENAELVGVVDTD